jgi:hypothetical protein
MGKPREPSTTKPSPESRVEAQHTEEQRHGDPRSPDTNRSTAHPSGIERQGSVRDVTAEDYVPL